MAGWICDEDEVKDFLKRLLFVLRSGDETTTLYIVKEIVQKIKLPSLCGNTILPAELSTKSC